MALPMSSMSAGTVDAMLSKLFCIASSSSPVAPVFLMIASYPLSTPLNAATDAVPSATIGPVTFCVSCSPTSETLLPNSCSFWPAAAMPDPNEPVQLSPAFSASFSAVSALFISALKSLSACSASLICASVSAISRVSASCALMLFSSSPASLKPSIAVFAASSFSFSAWVCSFSSFCFCVTSSTFFGSSSRSLSTSFSADCTSLTDFFALFRLLTSPFVSPLSSIVMPRILPDAILPP